MSRESSCIIISTTQYVEHGGYSQSSETHRKEGNVLNQKIKWHLETNWHICSYTIGSMANLMPAGL